MQTMTPAKLNRLATHPLQSAEWAEFRREWGNKVLSTRHGVITLHHIPYTNYKVGTLIRGTKPTNTMLSGLKKIAREENIIFIKLEPNIVINRWNTSKKHIEKKVNNRITMEKTLRKSGAREGKTLFTPTSFQINLTKPEDELMNEFNSKTRYNIRYADRKGVTVKEDNSDKAFEEYIRLMKETVERQKFYAHSEKYHRLMWKHLHKNMVSTKKKPIARLLTATYNPPSRKASEGHRKEVITAWIVFVWKDTMYYPYGASTDNYKNVQANSAMMWNAILYGKRNKLKKFDLWGREEGKGFTRFKEGFNPSVVEFLGTWDLVTSNLYWPYRVADYIRWKVLRSKSKFSTPNF